MKVLTTLRKLSDLDVKFVSLVDRGANRIPFRIIKSQEKEMSLDLSKLGFRVKKASSETAQAQTATIAAVILANCSPEIITKSQAVLGNHGVDLSEYTEFEDGTVALHKEDDAFTDGGTIVRLNESVAVVLKNMGKHLDNLKKSAFAEQAEANGYFDGPSLTMEYAQEALRVGMQKAETPTAASALMRDSMESVNQYLGFLTEAMPSAVLKMESELESIVLSDVVVEKAAAKKKPVEGTAEEEVVEGAAEEAAEAAAGMGDKADKMKAKKAAKPVVEPDVEDAEDEADPAEETEAMGKKKKVPVEAACAKPAKKLDEQDEDILKAAMSEAEKAFMAGLAGGAKMAFMRMTPDERAAEMKGAVKKSESDDSMEKVLKAMSDMAFAVATLTKNVGTLSADITQIKKSTEEKIDVLAKKAETATHAVRGTVLASEVPGDPQPIAKIKKVDSDPRTGVFDSAMLSRNR